MTESSRLEFLEKFSANNFALSDAEDNTSESLNRGVIADLSLLRTPLGIRQKSWPNFWEVMDSFLQVEEPFCNNYYFRIILMVQTKKVISMNYGNSASSWKPWRWMRLDLIFSMRDIYINSNLNPLKKFSGSRSTKL